MMISAEETKLDLDHIKLIVAFIRRMHDTQQIRELITNLHLIGEQEEDIDASAFILAVEELIATIFPEADYCKIQGRHERDWRIQRKYINDDVVKMMTKLDRKEYCRSNRHYGLELYDEKSKTKIALFLDSYNKVTGIRWTPDSLKEVIEIIGNKLPEYACHILYHDKNFDDEPKSIKDALDFALAVARDAI